MILKADAVKKWCPFVRLVKGHNGGYVNNRADFEARVGDINTDCLAEGCMAWQRGLFDGYGECLLMREHTDVTV